MMMTMNMQESVEVGIYILTIVWRDDAHISQFFLERLS